MTTKEENLISVLETATGKSVYWGMKQETDNNCVVVYLAGKQRWRSMEKVLNVSRDRFLLVLYGSSESDVIGLSDSIFGAIQNNKTDFMWAVVENEQDQTTQIDVGLYSRQVEIFVW